MFELKESQIELVNGGFVVHGFSCSASALTAGLSYLAAGGNSHDPGFAEMLGVACLAGAISPAHSIANLIRNAVGAGIGGAVTGSGSIRRSRATDLRLTNAY